MSGGFINEYGRSTLQELYITEEGIEYQWRLPKIKLRGKN